MTSCAFDGNGLLVETSPSGWHYYFCPSCGARYTLSLTPINEGISA